MATEQTPKPQPKSDESPAATPARAPEPGGGAVKETPEPVTRRDEEAPRRTDRETELRGDGAPAQVEPEPAREPARPDDDDSRTTLDLRPVKSVNSTDASRGEPLARRAALRRAELEDVLQAGVDAPTRSEIERALSSIDALLTGDVEHLSAPTAAQINRWLEGAKHLGEVAPRREATRRAG